VKKILFYGAGNISQALVMGLLSSGFNKNNIEYIDRNLSSQKNLKKLKKKKAGKKNISKIDVFCACG
jgi:Pyrroline-5-carboxylate reductase